MTTDGAVSPVTRRALLGAMLTGGLVSACSRATGGTAATTGAASTSASGATSTVAASASTMAATSPSSPSAPSVRAAALPTTHTWVARTGEVSPSVKRVATTLVETLGAWSHGQGDVASARARLSKAGYDPALAGELTSLLGVGTDAVVAVRDAQYGGILSSTASVLVVVDQWRLTSDGAVHAGGTTVDVRLEKGSPHWRVVAVHPAAPGLPTSSLTRSARSVLADSRIHLPHAAHADVAAGRIHDTVLSLLLAMAQQHIVDVSILRSGHPLYVFGTSRASDHPKGRAVDVWALDGKPLVLQANHTLAASAMRFASAHGAYNVGGPVLLSGSGFFSDRTHQDHIHLGYNH
jgi:hypothetical protein